MSKVMAAASEVIPKDLSPKYFESKITALITAALRTDGVGRTKKINKNNIMTIIQSLCLIGLNTN